eukprot:CAMPEP_0119422326 /NCGR_PEP_ID=MMETSP1335-20130426/27972_1 /TAXON_ID=259385 /ORGANISM="Chrysoculter rhomboideus, Strain RCC1486" /LENGTH=72 /DNA_ID=CAMNT_0007447773 /DNA_START=457 /DNA_END=675 /DNA_ORIENTATION=-
MIADLHMALLRPLRDLAVGGHVEAKAIRADAYPRVQYAAVTHRAMRQAHTIPNPCASPDTHVGSNDASRTDH